MTDEWRVVMCGTGLKVVNRQGKPLVQRWTWLNPTGRRRRPDLDIWICRSRALVFSDYRKAVRTVKRLNKTFLRGQQRADRERRQQKP